MQNSSKQSQVGNAAENKLHDCFMGLINLYLPPMSTEKDALFPDIFMPINHERLESNALPVPTTYM